MLRTLVKLAVTYAITRALTNNGKRGGLLDSLFAANKHRKRRRY